MSNIKKITLVGVFSSIVILHFIANATGLYEMRIIWFDNVLHFLTGIAFALVWLWVFRGSLRGAITFVVGLAIIWELLEFGFLKLFPVSAHSLSIFSPTLSEALEDIVSNVLGAIVLVIFIKFKYHKQHE